MQRLKCLLTLATVSLLVASCAADSKPPVEASTEEVAEPATTTTTTMAPTTTAQPVTVSLSILSYNVAGLPVGISQSNPDVNSPFIGQRLGGFDIVVLQEDFGFYSDLIEAEASHDRVGPLHPGPAELNPIDRDGVLAGDGLRRYASKDFDEFYREPWTDCFGGIDTSDGGAGDCLALKGFSSAVHDIGDGLSIVVINLHVEAGNTDADLAAATAGLRQLADFISGLDSDFPVVVAGDWNLHPDRDHEAALLDEFSQTTGLVDVCDLIDCGDDNNEIDRVMVRSSPTAEIAAVSHRFAGDDFTDAAGEPLSDHDPLVVELTVSASAR